MPVKTPATLVDVAWFESARLHGDDARRTHRPPLFIARSGRLGKCAHENEDYHAGSGGDGDHLVGGPGRTWTPALPLFDFGVWPCALMLGNGALALSYGRPAVHLAFDPEGTGESWPVRMPVIECDPAAVQRHSCGYTSLLPLDEDSFLLAYSDFLHRNAGGQPCKTIFVRHISVKRQG